MCFNFDSRLYGFMFVLLKNGTSKIISAYTLLLEVEKMAYSDRELIARIIQCEARRRRR